MTLPDPALRKPSWLKIRPNFGPEYVRVKAILDDLKLHTVCREASCPNIGECFSAGTATFIILGDKCTRNCRFCDIESGSPLPPDCAEPRNLALAVRKLGLKYAVVTSVTRDDLPDGGAAIFAETVNQIRHLNPRCQVELLIPDLKGNPKALKIILEARPDVLAHNLETVPALYSRVRPQADYRRSLDLLWRTATSDNGPIVKSGIMVGLGEDLGQIEIVLADAAAAGCQIFTVGQYLAPSPNHLRVERYYRPDEFDQIKYMGEKIGIPYVESGPLVRSSYMAHRQTEDYRASRPS